VKTLIKYVTGISLLLVWLGPVLFSLFFYIRQSAIHSEMEQKLSSHELQQLIIPEEDVIWMDDHEIRVDGMMFDIQHFSLNDGVYTFTGLFDEEETKLMNQQDENTTENQQKNQVLTQLVKWFQVTYKADDTNECFTPYCATVFISFLHTPLSDLLKPVEVPPPKSFCPYYYA
jgi:hypothetical protein